MPNYYEKLNMICKYSFDEVNQCGIYCIKCIPNGRIYVGMTRKTFLKRWLEHQSALNHNHHNHKFVNSWKKYGASNFECIILEIMPKFNNEDDKIEWLNENEIKWISYYKELLGERELLNCNNGGDGYNPTDDTRKLQSAHIKIAFNKPEMKEKLSKISKERWKDKDRLARMQLNVSINQQNPVNKSLISNATKERWKQKEYKEKLSNSIRKGLNTPESKKKRSEIMKRKFKDPKYRAKNLKAVKQSQISRVINANMRIMPLLSIAPTIILCGTRTKELLAQQILKCKTMQDVIDAITIICKIKISK